MSDPFREMRVATVHPEPWTTDALYSLPEDGMRHELLDGTLLVTRPPSLPHQLAARRLVAALADAAPGDVEVLEAVGVALPAGLLVPDVVIARAAAVHTATRELTAGDVLAVAEIVSPSSRTSDRRWKPEAYAEAGIGVFIRVELDTAAGQPEVLVHELAEDAYRVTAVARASEPTTVAVPFPVTITASDLPHQPRPLDLRVASTGFAARWIYESARRRRCLQLGGQCHVHTFWTRL